MGDRPCIKNNTASFRVTVTTKDKQNKDKQKHYRTIYSTSSGEDTNFDNVNTFLNAVLDYQRTHPVKIFEQKWSPLMQRAFGVKMIDPERRASAPGVMEPSKRPRRTTMTRLSNMPK